jgi:hypothetical protein
MKLPKGNKTISAGILSAAVLAAGVQCYASSSVYSVRVIGGGESALIFSSPSTYPLHSYTTGREAHVGSFPKWTGFAEVTEWEQKTMSATPIPLATYTRIDLGSHEINLPCRAWVAGLATIAGVVLMCSLLYYGWCSISEMQQSAVSKKNAKTKSG